MYIFTSLSRNPWSISWDEKMFKMKCCNKKSTSFVLTFDMPLKRSCYRNIMKGVLLFCTVLHRFWYSQDTWTVCLLIFKNKYYKGKLTVGPGVCYFSTKLIFQPRCAVIGRKGGRRGLLLDTDISFWNPLKGFHPSVCDEKSENDRLR